MQPSINGASVPYGAVGVPNAPGQPSSNQPLTNMTSHDQFTGSPKPSMDSAANGAKKDQGWLPAAGIAVTGVLLAVVGAKYHEPIGQWFKDLKSPSKPAPKDDPPAYNDLFENKDPAPTDEIEAMNTHRTGGQKSSQYGLSEHERIPDNYVASAGIDRDQKFGHKKTVNPKNIKERDVNKGYVITHTRVNEDHSKIVEFFKDGGEYQALKAKIPGEGATYQLEEEFLNDVNRLSNKQFDRAQPKDWPTIREERNKILYTKETVKSGWFGNKTKEKEVYRATTPLGDHMENGILARSQHAALLNKLALDRFGATSLTASYKPGLYNPTAMPHEPWHPKAGTENGWNTVTMPSGRSWLLDPWHDKVIPMPKEGDDFPSYLHTDHDNLKQLSQYKSLDELSTSNPYSRK